VVKTDLVFFRNKTKSIQDSNAIVRVHRVLTIYYKILQLEINNQTLIAHAIKFKEDDACKPTSLGYEY
jgi:hypothetical protein